MSDSSQELSVTAEPQPAYRDELFEVMAHRRRRIVIERLLEHEGAISLPDLADEVASREQSSSLADIPAEDVKEVYLSLYHVHIPKLADADIVEYDQDQDLVLPSTHAGLVSQFFETGQ